MKESLNCKYCGEALAGRQKVCCQSERCIKAYQAEYRRTHRKEMKRIQMVESKSGTTTYTNICARCGTAFTFTEGRGGAKYCSEQCRKAAYAEQHRKAALKYSRQKSERGNGIW